METSSKSVVTALVCLRKNSTPICFRITMKHGSPVTKVVADEPTTLEAMQYKIEGDDRELRKHMISHIVDNYAANGPNQIWEVIDLDS